MAPIRSVLALLVVPSVLSFAPVSRLAAQRALRRFVGDGFAHLQALDFGWLAGQSTGELSRVFARGVRGMNAILRLLVFNVKEGWAPLCDFLGKEIPDQPFPNVNESAELERATKIMKGLSYAWVPALAASLAIACACFTQRRW